MKGPAFLAWIVFFAGALYGETLVVPAQYAKIQDALAAATDGDEIIVRPGLYKENIDFLGKAVWLRSDLDGDAGTVDPVPCSTVIDGSQAGSAVNFVSGEGHASVLEGFTVTNGSGRPQGQIFLGGGICCHEHSSPTIRYNIITGNKANGGGGISCVNFSEPLLIRNEFSYNEAVGSGGAIRCYEKCNALIRFNFVHHNKAGSKGAGAFLAGSSPEISCNVFTDNLAHTGAGIHFGWTFETALVEGNLLGRNRTTFGVGGGFSCDGSLVVVRNNIIWGNEASNGGGIYCGWNKPEIVNNTITGNKAANWGGALFCTMAAPKLFNNILWGNEAEKNWPEIYGAGKQQPVASHCDIQGGYPGEHNLDADPAFADPKAEDFHLLFTSPCRDAGTQKAPGLPDLDFEGDPRSAYRTVDMGADEFHTHLYFTGLPAPGGSVAVKVAGDPGKFPVILWVGSETLQNPVPTAHGFWYLALPLLLEAEMGIIPREGIAHLPFTFPRNFPGPWRIVMQAIVEDELTKPCEMMIRGGI